MTREELREKVASVIAYGDGLSPVLDHHRRTADSAIALLRAETLEEAAKVAGPSPDDAGTHRSYRQGREDAAAAIRALIPSEVK